VAGGILLGLAHIKEGKLVSGSMGYELFGLVRGKG
jgi:hypothetical protein